MSSTNNTYNENIGKEITVLVFFDLNQVRKAFTIEYGLRPSPLAEDKIAGRIAGLIVPVTFQPSSAVFASNGLVDMSKILQETLDKIPEKGFPDISTLRNEPGGHFLLPSSHSDTHQLFKRCDADSNRFIEEYYQSNRFCAADSFVPSSRLFGSLKTSIPIIMAFYPPGKNQSVTVDPTRDTSKFLGSDETKALKLKQNLKFLAITVTEYMLPEISTFANGQRISETKIKIRFVRLAAGVPQAFQLDYKFKYTFPLLSIDEVIDKCISSTGENDKYAEWSTSDTHCGYVYHAVNAKGSVLGRYNVALKAFLSHRTHLVIVPPTDWTEDQVISNMHTKFVPHYLQESNDKEDSLEKEISRLRSLLISAVSDRAQALLPAQTSAALLQNEDSGS